MTSPVHTTRPWLRVACTAFAILAMLAPAATADDEQEPPAHVSLIEGVVRLEREGAAEDAAAGTPLVPGDRLRTEAGRAELRLSDGGSLHLDRFSELDVLSDLAWRLNRGRLHVTLVGGARQPLSLDAPGAAVTLRSDGEYRLTVGGTGSAEIELAVVRGNASLENEQGTVELGTGERSRVVDGAEPSAPEWFNAADKSDLESWADERRETWYADSSQSETYLPDELDVYGATFDRYGSWRSDATYGYAWYPSVVNDWRPYGRGRWSHVPRFGWTWITYDPWGWPTHHYGRWGLNAAGAWFWVPSRRWGPAWVYWAVSPSFVAWCPLGWNGFPVINTFHVGGKRFRGFHPWRAWTALPSHRFAGVDAWRHRVDRVTFDRERSSFVMRHVAPPRSPPERAESVARAPMRRPPTMSPRGTPAPARSATTPLVSRGFGERAAPLRGPRFDPNERVGRSARPRGRDGSPYDRAAETMDRSVTDPRVFQRSDWARPDRDVPRAAPRRPESRRNEWGDESVASPGRPARTPGAAYRSPRGRDGSGLGPGVGGPPPSGYAAPRRPSRSGPPPSFGPSSPAPRSPAPPSPAMSSGAPRGEAPARSDGGGRESRGGSESRGGAVRRQR
jgi:hypothetical protein